MRVLLASGRAYVIFSVGYIGCAGVGVRHECLYALNSDFI